MKEINTLLKRGEQAVEKLRETALQNGESFLLYDKELPEGQYYMEYPDGDIKIVSVSRRQNDFIVHSELDALQVLAIRRRLKLNPVVFMVA